MSYLKRNQARLRRGIRFESLEERRLLALVPELVADVNTEANSSKPRNFTEFNDYLYFVADDRDHGPALWRTVGTDVEFVLDISPSDDTPLYINGVSNGRMFLTGGPRYDFFAFDGTTAQSLEKLQIHPFSPPSVWQFTDMGEYAYFSATSLEYGRDLWRTDGTQAGTYLIKNISPNSWNLDHFIVNNNLLYFSAEDQVHGRELWRSDGTAEGTHVLSDLRPGSGSSNPRRIIDMEQYLLFVADDGVHGDELWRFDLRSGAAHLLNDLENGERDPWGFTRIGSQCYFVANDPLTGRELWVTDGTSAGTRRVADVNPGVDSSYPEAMREFQGELLFFAFEVSYGRELWMSDGTEAGTRRVSDTPLRNSGIQSTDVAETGGKLFFIGDTSTEGRELWSTDGTAENTVMFLEMTPGPQGGLAFSGRLFTFQSHVYFNGASPLNGIELWQSNGLLSGTRMLADVFPGTLGSRIQAFGEFNGDLVFSLQTADDRWSLLKSNGTSEGTAAVFHARIGNGGSVPYGFVEYNGHLFFAAYDSESQRNQLWRTNGLPGDIHKISSTNSTNMLSDPGAFTLFRNELYFTALRPSGRQSLWRTDGSSDDLYEIDLGVPWEASFYRPFVANGSLLFGAVVSGFGTEIWAIDEDSEIMPRLVGDVFPGQKSGFNGFLGTTGFGTAYFFGGDSEFRPELWRTDGTVLGTKEVVANLDSLSPFYAGQGLAMEDSIYFFASAMDADVQIWSTNGTQDGTVQVSNLPRSSVTQFEMRGFVREGLLFTAIDAEAGMELWRTDHNDVGAVRVKDLFPGPQGSNPSSFVQVRDRAVFAANDGQHGAELWVTDGSESGTYMIADIFTGSAGSTPASLTVIGDVVYFTADDGFHGRELWKLDLGPLFGQPGDTNFDGNVDLTDLNNVRNHFGETGNVLGDADGNGVVDLADLNAVRNNFGTETAASSQTSRTLHAGRDEAATSRGVTALRATGGAAQPLSNARATDVLFSQWLSSPETSISGSMSTRGRTRNEIRRLNT